MYDTHVYDIWGAVQWSSGTGSNDGKTVVIEPTYTGHPYDPILGIYFAEARFYDAVNRQWMASDPIKSGLNWYEYVGSNPTTFFDPNGLEAEEPGIKTPIPQNPDTNEVQYIESGNYYMNDQYVHTKVSPKTGEVYGDLFDMVSSIGGTAGKSSSGALERILYAVADMLQFNYVNGRNTSSLFAWNGDTQKISDYLDLGKNTRADNLYMSMSYFAKLACQAIGLGAPIWGQKLVFPRPYNIITAGYKYDAPGYSYDGKNISEHSGIDISRYIYEADGSKVEEKNVYGMGIGEVIYRDWNDSMGNLLQVVYKDVLINGGPRDVVVTYAHLEEKSDKEAGSIIAPGGESVGIIGNTGVYGGKYEHLHLEIFEYEDGIVGAGQKYPSESLAYERAKYFGEGKLESYNPLDILWRQDENQIVIPTTDDKGVGEKWVLDPSKIGLGNLR